MKSTISILVVVACVAGGGCATSVDPKARTADTRSVLDSSCEWTRAKGSHIKEMRCASPQNSFDRLKRVSRSGGNSRLNCSGQKDICDTVRDGTRP